MSDAESRQRATDPLLRLREQIAAQRRAAATAPAAEGDAIAESLTRAAQVADAGAALPPFAHLGPLRRAVAVLSGRLVLYFLRLVTTDQRQFNHLVLRLFAALAERVRELRGMEEVLARGLARLLDDPEQLAKLERTVAALSEQQAELSRRQTDLQRAHDETAALHVDQRIIALESGLAERDRWFGDLIGRDEAAQHALGELRETAAYLRGQITDRDRRIDALLAEVAARHGAARPVEAAGAPPAVAAAPAPALSADQALDAWAFVEAFRGTEGALRELQRHYVRYFVGRGEVLDLGCGRGEFLELLRDAGIAARGVDLSNEMVLRCREKELDVQKAEALSFLAALPDGSLGGIFCAQVVEHLDAATVLALIQLAYAKLRPDGVLLIETLNPECLLVHYRWFWMDLTHVRLIHPETLKFLLVSHGFRDLEGLFTTDREPAPLLPPLQIAGADAAMLARFNAATAHLNTLLHGSPDYALVARR